MEFNRWWNNDIAEIYWLEVTDRKNLGEDLNAPQRKDNGEEYYGYSLIKEINNGDIIFHYHKDSRAIVATSKASGNVGKTKFSGVPMALQQEVKAFGHTSDQAGD